MDKENVGILFNPKKEMSFVTTLIEFENLVLSKIIKTRTKATCAHSYVGFKTSKLLEAASRIAVAKD